MTRFVSIALVLAGCSGCLEQEMSTCITTLWASRPYTGPIILDGSTPRTEIYAAARTLREIEGSACEAEAHLEEIEPPLAWSHDCGCEQ